MKPKINHPWALTELEAQKLQQELAAKVIKEDQFDEIKLIAGVDVAYSSGSEQLMAAVVILEASTLEPIETATAKAHAQHPYIPGLFSFRELPPLINALEKLCHTPDLIFCDGQGYAHPRRFGLACHLGVLFDVPTIGCSKSRLIGEYPQPDIPRGARAPLVDTTTGEVIGSALRTQSGIKPIFVSIGHRISLMSACEWTLQLSPKYRLPETIRQADHAVRTALKESF